MIIPGIFTHICAKQDFPGLAFRIFWWKFNQIFLKIPAIIELVPGTKCVCYPISSYGGLVVYTKLPDYFEQTFLLKNLKADSCFVDVGANIGVYSLLASSKITSGKIFAFEVSDAPLINLYENIALNKLDGKVQVVERLVSDKNGHEQFIEESISEISHIGNTSERDKGRICSSVKLDSFLKINEVKKVDLVKIDVEGAEFKVLKGLRRFLQDGKVKFVLIEINKNVSNYGSSPSEVFTFLNKFGYFGYSFNKKGKLVRIYSKQIKDNTTNNYIFMKSGQKFNL